MIVREIINNLPPNDGRIDFWENVDKKIRIGELDYVFYNLLSNHRDDYDFSEQLSAVCSTIEYYRIGKDIDAFLSCLETK